MKRYVLICQNIERHPALFVELQRILEQRSEEGQFDVVTLDQFDGYTVAKQNEILDELNFVCFHTDAEAGDLVNEASNRGIPIILVRGETVPNRWSRILQRCGVGDNIDIECAKKMIYLVDEINDIRGALRWVSDFYEALVEKKMERIIHGYGGIATGQSQGDQN